MRFITQLSRIIVGALFIFSGLIKLNDPMGFSFKLEEYFSEPVLDLPFLQPYALALALFIVVLEVLLGLALLLGYWSRFTVWLLLIMTVFFTFLTFYSAYFNKVTDCGCFGDAIPLTPWESFGKDVILTVLIIILVTYQKYINPIMPRLASNLSMLAALVLCIFMGYHVLNHLPIRDFRAYAEGKDLKEGMRSAEELGLDPPKYMTIYHMINTETGEEKTITSEAYISDKWWEKDQWEIQSDKTESRKVSEGYEPPIHDFVITFKGEDQTEEVLNAPAVFLLIAYDISKTEKEAYDGINEFASNAQDAGVPFVGLSASLERQVEEMRHELQTPFPFASADGTTLKTIIRSNPGIVLLKNGVVIKKWHYNDLPEYSEVSSSYL